MTTLDKVIITLAVAIGIVSFSFIKASSFDSNKKSLLVIVNNKTVRKITTDTSEESKIYEFEFDNNTGYIEMKNGAARVLKMDKSICPRGICSEFGWVSKKYETIVCMPNKIVVLFEESSDELDVVSS